MKRNARNLFSFLSVSSLWISFVSAFQPALLQYASSQAITPEYMVVALLVTFAVYAADKVSGSVEDLINTPERAWLAHYPVKQLATVTYVLAILIVAAIDIWKLPFPLAFGVAGWIYARRIGKFRVKDIPGAKTVVVAGATSICFAGLVGGPWWLYALEFLLIGIDTILFDLRDLRGDALNGVRTLPVLLGRSKTLVLLAGMDALLACLYWPAAAYGAFLIYYFRKERDSLSYDQLVDGWSMWVLAALYLSHLLI